MLRIAGRRAASQIGWMRPFTSTPAGMAEEAAAQDKGPKAFTEKFLPNMIGSAVNPQYPSDFIKKAEKSQEEGVPEKLTLNFFLPHKQEVKAAKVDMVLVPAVTGDFGVCPGHVPTVAQLRPGVVTIHNTLDKEVDKFFVSSGFAFVHADSSADVVAVEAVKLEDLDTEAVRAGLQDYLDKLASVQAKGDDYEIAAAQIGVEVYSAMSSAVGAS